MANIALASNGSIPSAPFDGIRLNDGITEGQVEGVSAHCEDGGNFIIEFPHVYFINEIRFNIGSISYPSDYSVYVSYSSQPTEGYELITGRNCDTAGERIFMFPQRLAKRVKISVNAGAWCWVRELEVYSIPEPFTVITDGKVDLLEGEANVTLFTFNAVYGDSTNIDTKTGYPRIHICMGEKEIKNALMSPVEFMDFTYTDGKAYKYGTKLPYRGQYTFWFETYNSNNVYARTDVYQGLTVSGVKVAPTLAWTGEAGYNKGVKPIGVDRWKGCEYRVKYIDENNDLPENGTVYLFAYNPLNELVSTVDMDYVSGSPAIGMIFSKVFPSMPGIPMDGRYSYRFAAKDIMGATAIGEPYALQSNPTVSAAPILHYTGEAGFETTWLQKEVVDGKLKSITVRLMYTSKANDKPYPAYPKLHIYYNGVEVAGESPKIMAKVTEHSNYSVGVIYGFTGTILPLRDESKYTFSLECLNRWECSYDGTVYPPLNSVEWQEQFAKQNNLIWQSLWVDATNKDSAPIALQNVDRGTPSIYKIETDIMILDKVTKGSLLLDYYSTPVSIVGETDTLSIPKKGYNAIMLYVLGQVQERLKDWDGLSLTNNKYEKEITGISTVKQSQELGTLWEQGGGYGGYD
ncbi:MAG: hypothetical protein ABH870_06215 [bacterium]